MRVADKVGKFGVLARRWLGPDDMWYSNSLRNNLKRGTSLVVGNIYENKELLDEKKET